MISWERLPQTYKPEEWDRLLLESHDHTVFQSYGWGEYRRTFGWLPVRWIARNKSGAVLAMAQILIKKLPLGLSLCWCPGGPILTFPETSNRDVALIIELLLRRIKALKRAYIRFNSYLPHDTSLAYAFSRSCVRPVVSLTTGYSLVLNLEKPFSLLVEEMKARHRAYVRKSMSHEIECRAGRDATFVQEFVSLHNEMTTRKGLAIHRTTVPEISALCRHLGEQAMIFTGYLNGEALSSYLILSFGGKAFYLKAAAGDKGRKIRASYAVFVKLLEYLQNQGLIYFDLGGMDAQTPAAEGVNRFKRGFGGELVEYLGEWEWASAKWLRWATNFAICYRGKRL